MKPNSPRCLPLLSAETREEERGGAEEEAVGGPGAGEDFEQITVLQRGEALIMSLRSLPPTASPLLIKPQRFLLPAVLIQ